MANTTKNLSRSGAWVELTGGAAPTTFRFENYGPASIIVQNAAAEPAAGASGTLYRPGEGERMTTMTRAWARTELADAAHGADATVYVEET